MLLLGIVDPGRDTTDAEPSSAVAPALVRRGACRPGAAQHLFSAEVAHLAARRGDRAARAGRELRIPREGGRVALFPAERKRSGPGASGGEGGERVTAVVGGDEFAEVGEQRAAL
jgi:hypothetical protein